MTLDEATAQYWDVMRAYNRRLPRKPVSTERALKMLNAVLEVTGPHHPLAVKVNELRDKIIIGD